jgi:hypothetical protein
MYQSYKYATMLQKLFLWYGMGFLLLISKQNTMNNYNLNKTDYAVLSTLILGFIALMVLLG